MLTSPKPKPIKIEISNIKQVHNNNNNISTTSSTFNTKDIQNNMTEMEINGTYRKAYNQVRKYLEKNGQVVK